MNNREENRELNARKKNKLWEDLKQRREQRRHENTEMSSKLKQLLSRDLTAAKAKEKKRSAEILGVFANHNFYAGGFTPEELRTTLEDLGPTYVKIGQFYEKYKEKME